MPRTVLATVLIPTGATVGPAAAKMTVLRTPDGGIQPQAVADAKAFVAQAVIRDARIVTIGFGSRDAHGRICPALERNLPKGESGVRGRGRPESFSG